MEPSVSSPPQSAPVHSRRSYRSLPIHEPFKPKYRGLNCNFVLDKAWPKSSLPPRRRLPQTSSLLWRRKLPPKFSTNHNVSQLSELKCMSQHDDIFLNTHLSSSDPLLDAAVPFVLPDRSTVLVSTHLEGLLKQLLERRMVGTVLKYVQGEESGGVFRYVFGLKQVRRPLRKVEDCPLDIRMLIISPTKAITLEKAAFDPIHNSIIPSSLLNSHSFLPISTLFQKNSTVTKLTHKSSFPLHQPQSVSTAILGRVDMPPFQADTVIRESLKKPKAASTVRNVDLWSARVVESSEMVVTARPSVLSGAKDKAEFKRLNGGKLIEGNAGFRRPQPSPIATLAISRSSGSLPRAFSLTGSSQGFKAEAKGKRTLLKLSDSLLKQLDVASFCARYSLTEKEFAKLVEEFVVMAAGGEGVRVDVLCAHYRIEKEALRGINPAFDGALLPWKDFVSFYSLAISQRSQLSDLLTYLLTVSVIQFTNVSSLYHLTVDYMFEALQMRLLPASRMTETIKRIWSSLCISLVGEREVICAGEERRIDIEAAVEAAWRGEVSVLDLRYLVAELFQAPSLA